MLLPLVHYLLAHGEHIAELDDVFNGVPHHPHVKVGLLQEVGLLRGELPIEFVSPRVWKKRMGLTTADKETSRAMAIRMFPLLAKELARKGDDGRAEALLIAEYGRRIWGAA